MIAAGTIIERCRTLAGFTEEQGYTTRTFLSEPMRGVHACVGQWMTRAGMTVSVDPSGNLRGLYPAAAPGAKRLIIASHLDTVPRAGAFDGILGVVLGVALVESLGGRRLDLEIEVIGFSEEEGVRFGVPFIGSRALIGDGDFSAPIQDAIAAFGLDPSRIGDAATDAAAYLEFHIEQGPVLEDLKLPLGIVEAIAGQSRLELVFEGKANHAGTTPMILRRDALACAAEWIGTVEREARNTFGIVATVGKLEVSPGAGNVIPGAVRASLDVRHARDLVRHNALERILNHATDIAHARRIAVSWTQSLDQAAVPMDKALTRALEKSVAEAGYPVHYMMSGAGHDAMIVARKMPVAMLFLRSPGGISHHPDEAVLEEDVAAAMETGMRFLVNMESHAQSRPHP